MGFVYSFLERAYNYYEWTAKWFSLSRTLTMPQVCSKGHEFFLRNTRVMRIDFVQILIYLMQESINDIAF